MSQEAGNANASHVADAASGAHEAAGGFPPFEASLFSHQIFWFAVSFCALYLLIAIVIVPKISGTIAKRKNQIANDLKLAADEAEKAEAAKTEAVNAQTNARNNARAKLDAMRAKIDEQNAKASTLAVAEDDERIKASEIAINAQKNDALVNISSEVTDIASAIFEQITGKAPTATILKAATKGAN